LHVACMLVAARRCACCKQAAGSRHRQQASRGQHWVARCMHAAKPLCMLHASGGNKAQAKGICQGICRVTVTAASSAQAASSERVACCTLHAARGQQQAACTQHAARIAAQLCSLHAARCTRRARCVLYVARRTRQAASSMHAARGTQQAASSQSWQASSKQQVGYDAKGICQGICLGYDAEDAMRFCLGYGVWSHNSSQRSCCCMLAAAAYSCVSMLYAGACGHGERGGTLLPGMRVAVLPCGVCCTPVVAGCGMQGACCCNGG
jgi:hypothetical protein